MAQDGPRWPKTAQDDGPEKPFLEDAPRKTTTFISEKKLRHLIGEINVSSQNGDFAWEVL